MKDVILMIFINPEEECSQQLKDAVTAIVMQVRASTDSISGRHLDYFSGRMLLQMASGNSETWRVTVEREIDEE